jgi:hypothetical protein
MSALRAFPLVLALFIAVPCAAQHQSPLSLADFERESQHIHFSPGAEFPGATGRFERTGAAAFSGQYGGRLHFDFSGGGRYVAMIVQPTQSAEQIAASANALDGWIRSPAGHELTLRFTDTAGQTFQKPLELARDDWVRVTVPLRDWTQHWGGPNDGQVRGGPVGLALLVEAGESPTGHVDFDELQLVWQPDNTARVIFASHRFTPREGWTLHPHGPAGDSRLDGRIARLDFKQGAQAFSLVPPDRSIPGNVERLHLRVYGSVRALPVSLSLRTHFMTFHKSLGTLSGDGHLELATDGPPGAGWEWSGGENDGKLHGPLRVGEIRLERPPDGGVIDVELEEILIEASCPSSKRCLVSAALYSEAAEPEFRFVARALTDAPLKAVVRWELRDWEGTRLDHGHHDIVLASRAEPVEFRLPIPRIARERLRFIEGEFQLEVPGQEVAPVHAAWVAPIEDEGDTALRPGSPFGMGAYFYRYPGNAAGSAEMERAARVAQAAGVKWSREEFQWSRIEPRRGEFQWAFYDDLVETAKRHGIQVYAIVAYWSGWTKPYTAEGIDDYVRYLEALVRRYGRDIRHWEIWNEPNIFFWQGPKDLYAELLKKSYAAIKAIDPDAEVLGLSTAGIDFDYIRHVIELQAPFDILTIHPYRRTLNDREFLTDLHRVSDLVRRPDGTRRPVWLTELGWPTYSPHNTLRQDFVPTTLRAQAELIVRCYLLAIVSGIEPRTFWYNFRNDGEDPHYFEHQMGIVDRHFQPKPAYRTYATLTRVLANLSPDAELALDPETLAWTFTGDTQPTRRVTVLWNPRQDTVLPVPVRSRSVRRINAVGEEHGLEPRHGEVQVQLRRGAAIYLVEDDD